VTVRKRGLPDSIIEAVLHHHRPSETETRPFTPLIAVHIANILQCWHADGEKRALREFGLDEEQLGRIENFQLEDWLEHWKQEVIGSAPAPG
jgi:HD-like signal output (HDOD) protein